MKEGGFYTIMGESRILSILLALKDAKGPIILKDLQSVVGNIQSLRSRLDRMEEDGLVDMVVVLIGHKHVTVDLTDVGRDVSSLLSAVNVLVSPDKDVSCKSLDMRYADPILRMLRRREYLVQKEILDEMDSYRSIKRVLQALEDDGLVARVIKEEWPSEIRFSLTSFGRQIADIYQCVYEKIDSVRIKG